MENITDQSLLSASDDNFFSELSRIIESSRVLGKKEKFKFLTKKPKLDGDGAFQEKSKKNKKVNIFRNQSILNSNFKNTNWRNQVL